MTYEETLKFLYEQLPMYQRIGKAAYKANLNNTIALDKYFGHPHRFYKTIHIAGTNGKGSVAHTLASILQEAGYKTGLYTSPHYLDFRERIRINGQKIAKQYIIDFIKKNNIFFNEIKPSFFEITVAMAFQYFKDEGIDIAVIETGMGGRLDSTNIIKPLLSVITNVSYDHTQFLGESLEKIAFEKAGIIKKSVPVVLGDDKPAVKNVILKKAQETDSPVFLANHIFSIQSMFETSDGKMAFNAEKNGKIFYKNLKFGLTGLYQLKNLPVILQSFELLKDFLKLDENHLRRGLEFVKKNTGIIGRWEIFGKKPLIIIDAAHNADGIKAIIEHLNLIKFKKLHFVYGTVKDKNLRRILNLLPQNAIYYFTQAQIPRSLDSKKLQQEAVEFQLKGKFFNTVSSAIDTALEQVENNDLLLISGSTFIAAEAIEFFNKKNYQQ